MDTFSVMWTEWDDWSFYGVFDSRELAQEFIDNSPLPSYEDDMEKYKKGFFIIQGKMNEPRTY